MNLKGLFLAFLTVLVTSSCAFASSNSSWLVKHHETFKYLMMFFGAAFVILLIWEISYQVAVAQGKKSDVPISIVTEEKRTEEEGDPFKTLMKAQEEEEEEDVLPAFLDEKIEEEEKKEPPPKEEKVEEEEDPFKSLLKKAQVEEDVPSPVQKKISIPLDKKEDVEEEVVDDDPFKALLKTSVKDETVSSRRHIEIEPPKISRDEAKEVLERSAPASKKKLSFSLPSKKKEEKKESLKLSLKSVSKGKGKRLFAKISEAEKKGESEKGVEKKEPSVPPISVKALEEAILREQKLKQGVKKLEIEKEDKVVLKMPGDLKGEKEAPQKRVEKKVIPLEISPKKTKKEKEVKETPKKVTKPRIELKLPKKGESSK